MPEVNVPSGLLQYFKCGIYNMNYYNEWTYGRPTISGFYWFYGKRSYTALKDDLFFVRVRRLENGNCMYCCEGSLIDGAKGVWRKIENPELP